MERLLELFKFSLQLVSSFYDVTYLKPSYTTPYLIAIQENTKQKQNGYNLTKHQNPSSQPQFTFQSLHLPHLSLRPPHLLSILNLFLPPLRIPNPLLPPNQQRSQNTQTRNRRADLHTLRKSLSINLFQ